MTLEKQLLEIPILGGLGQQMAPEVLPPGSWLTLENVEYTEIGRLQKRQGFERLEDTVFLTEGAATALDVPHWVGAFGAQNELLAIATEASSAEYGQGEHLYAYRPTERIWLKRRPISPVTWQRYPLTYDWRSLLTGEVHAVTDSGLVFSAARLQTDDSGGVAIFAIVRDAETWAPIWSGQISQTQDDPDDLDVFYWQGKFYVFWANQGATNDSLRCWRYSAAALAPDAAPTTVVSTFGVTEGDWCVGPLSATEIAYVVHSTGDISQLLVHSILISSLTTVTYRATIEGVYPTNPTLHTNVDAGIMSIGFIDEVERFGTKLPYVISFNSATMTLRWGQTACETTGDWNQITVYVENASGWRTWAAWSGSLTDTDEMVAFSHFDSGGSKAGNNRLYHQELWSRPFEPYGSDGRVHLITTTYGGTVRGATESNPEADREYQFYFPPEGTRLVGYTILDISSHEGSGQQAARWLGSMAYRDGDPGSRWQLPRVSGLSGSAWWCPLLVISDQTGVAGAVAASMRFEGWDPTSARADLWNSAETNRTLLFSGGQTTIYDGRQVLEAGFLHRPQIASVNKSPGDEGPAGNATPNGNVYLYRAVYGWRDNAGKLHLSEPSDPYPVLIYTPFDSPQSIVHLRIKTTPLSRKEDTIPQQPMFLLVARTRKNSSGPYFLLNQPTMDLVNVWDGYAVVHSDNKTDEQMERLGYGFLYTDGGILPSQLAPPSTAVVVHKNRVWLADAEDRRRVWYSSILIDSEAPAFNLERTLRVDDSADEITGLATLDEGLVIFTRSRVYMVTGDGPLDTGATNDIRSAGFTGPNLISTSAGCISPRSVVSFEGGVLFQSIDGLQLLVGDGKIVPVGQAVRDELSSRELVRSAVLDAERRRVVWLVTNDTSGDARMVIFDYQRQAWMIWKLNHDQSQQTLGLWDRKLVCADSSGVNVQALHPTAAGYDPNDTWVTMKVKTPYIRVSAIGGFQRAQRLALTMHRQTDCTLSVRCFIDERSTTGNTETYDVTSTNFPGASVAWFTVGYAAQKCRSICFQITDAAPEEPDDGPRSGVALFGLTLQVGMKKGLFKAAVAGNRK